MKKVIVTIILFAITTSMIIGVVIPVSQQIKSTGQKTHEVVRSLNNNVVP